jgi:hypothetical protein
MKILDNCYDMVMVSAIAAVNGQKAGQNENCIIIGAHPDPTKLADRL